ncbi:unnamed protein product [Prorocentrum cordatum]|uniref:Uncharacterized protein n=1 Tax=Prorocentrum cordatum TaxID=2364126 RepID=A0ABN9T347_9DINO|nr:unnamed protein product [Polarella glacialis]
MASPGGSSSRGSYRESCSDATALENAILPSVTKQCFLTYGVCPGKDQFSSRAKEEVIAQFEAKFPTSVQDLMGMMMPGMSGGSGMPGMGGMPGSQAASPWGSADGAPDLGALGSLFGGLAAEPTLGAMPTAPTVAPVTSPMATMGSTPMASTAPAATAPPASPMPEVVPTATPSSASPVAEAISEVPSPAGAVGVPPPPPPRKAPTVIDADVAFLD